jgi:formate dehydrogenase major subunit
MTLIKETNYGTPARISDQMVTLEIDGQEVSVPAGGNGAAAGSEGRSGGFERRAR